MKHALLLSLILASCAEAHDLITTKITWSKEISRIVYAKCLSCHAEGISFVTYRDARPWAKAIKEEVLERRMPPWGAVKGFGEFQHDISLSQEEITLIAEWVEGGAPEGDPNLLPTRQRLDAPKQAARHGLPAHGNLTLNRDITLTGVRPVTAAADVQITARRPDGSIEPLLWLHNYKREWNRAFFYRTPLILPKGTIIEMSQPVDIELLTPAPKRVR